MQTVFYARVSVADQTLAHQVTQAKAAGFKIDLVISDEGVSGVSTRLGDRPEGRRLFDVLRKGDVLACRWVDRLGRDYTDVCETIRVFMNRGVIIRTVINDLTFDGSSRDPMQMAVRDALIGFMAAAAQAQAEVTKEAQRAGIAHAKNRPGSYLGRKPSYTRNQLETVSAMVGQNTGVSAIAKVTGLSRQTVYRIIADPTDAEASLARWES